MSAGATPVTLHIEHDESHKRPLRTVARCYSEIFKRDRRRGVIRHPGQKVKARSPLFLVAGAWVQLGVAG